MERTLVQFGGKKVGDGQPCFIVYEAGPTHDGLSSAKRLVALAADAGADAVKFQMVDPERLMADNSLLFTYKVLAARGSEELEPISEPLYDILKRRSLRREEWIELKAYSDSLGLDFFTTVAFDDEVELVEQMGCASIKVASADVNHWPLLRRCARTGLCIQLDTGSATLGEIEAAVDILRNEGNENIIIHHCPSGYPARLESINLNVIPTLKRMFPYPVAFSDHSPGWDMDIAAIALGANLLEKTITLDRMTRSVEHVFSLDPGQMPLFPRKVREVETALGAPRRVLHDVEREYRKANRRSAWLAGPARHGQKLSEAQVVFRRPGFGLGPDDFERFADSVFAQDLPAGEMLTLSHLEFNQ